LGGMMGNLVIERGEWFRLFTATLLHGNLEHIIFNGIAFWFAGSVLEKLLGRAWQTPALAGVFSGYRVNVPQLEVEVDRDKVKREGIVLTDLFQTMQAYLGSVYVNDFNKFGRTYQVKVQADAQFRATADNIAQLKVRNAAGAMIPLGSVVQVKESRGPDQATRYNG